MMIGDADETEIPPLVMVNPEIQELVVSPVLKITALEPDGGEMNVEAGPATLNKCTGRPPKFTDSL
jgi:hypothetical protein